MTQSDSGDTSVPRPVSCIPDILGDIDAWDVWQIGDRFRYSSGQWRTPRSYVMNRDGVSVADGPEEMRMVFATGPGWLHGHPARNAYPFHLLDHHESELEKSDSLSVPGGVAQAVLSCRSAQNRALPAYVLNQFAPADGSITGDHQKICDAASAIAEGAQSFGRRAAAHALLFVPGARDDVEGFDPTRFISECLALRDSLERAVQQRGAMHFLYTQWNGTTTDGGAPNAGDQSWLWSHDPLAPLVFATPMYPFNVYPLSPCELNAQGMIDFCGTVGLALDALDRNGSWRPAVAWLARLEDAKVEITFETLSDLVVDAENGTAKTPNMGFALDGVTNGASITEVTAQADKVTLTLSHRPEGDLTVRYAQGEAGQRATDGHVMNRGALRDSFAANHPLAKGKILYRWAAAFQLPVH